ncbi:MAG: hypothetical protein A2831_02655 [Candidatus Yanofskybacteria bacterium RIFCSPHIGHO2_01_FULL_44_17]|uniref:DUF5680 domain-containing protein n=1 Tax=Candidatus Yanofskybacteria bacterium RIFCSPHIGHO2_01_FULL_44_17 TaxID=1802668 RepID=A0A1F8EXD1_9BACT|nr:MAG: hypothetical protein A2831_02655 [Candidatus Yanofskybacteria bacterium RIFCSPHIGHO2_01_FULL_44_17]
MDLREFLVEAKKKTYASENATEEVLPNGTRRLEYAAYNFKYVDEYKGSNPFIGQELVWQNGVLVWGMNYYGGIYPNLSKPLDPKEIYTFLRSALRMPSENLPFRGPKNYKNGSLGYYNELRGTITAFSGHEKIRFEERHGDLYPYQPLYALSYHGGCMEQDGLIVAN